MIISRQVNGFTLVEVLVSLALLSLVSTILIASLELGGHSWRRVVRQAKNTDEIARAQDFLRQRLSALHPQVISQDGTPQKAALIGSNQELEFSGLEPGRDTVVMQRYRIGSSGADSTTIQVTYRSDSNNTSALSQSNWAQEPLLAHTAGIAIQYWEHNDRSSGRWLDRWEGRPDLPSLIRIEISFPAGDQREWPPLYIEPLVDTSPLCVFDVVSRRCRNGV